MVFNGMKMTIKKIRRLGLPFHLEKQPSTGLSF